MSEEERKSSLGAGDVTIILDGEEKVLKPSYGAAKSISVKYGGLSSAIERIMRLDIEATADIIGIGMGYTSTRRPPLDLAEKVFKSGLTDDTGALAERCVTFLRVLAGGGRLPVDEVEEAHQDSEDPPEG